MLPRAFGEPVIQASGSLRILLAEDNPINRLMTEELIKSLGHEIVSAETGIEALAALSAKRFDVVLMAGRMHEMDGIKANRRFRDGEAGDPVMPIVALTAYALEGDPERFLEEGMDDYLSKPVGLSELCEVLEHMKRGN